MRSILLTLLLFCPSALGQLGLYVPAGASFFVGDGEVDLGRTNIYVAGSLLIGSGQISAQDLTIAEGGVVRGGTGSIRVTRNWTNEGTFVAQFSTVYFDNDPETASIKSLAQVRGTTIFWNTVLAANKTVVVTDCSIRVANKRVEPDSSEVIEPGGSPASIELCSEGLSTTPVPIPSWINLLLIMTIFMVVRGKL